MNDVASWAVDIKKLCDIAAAGASPTSGESIEMRGTGALFPRTRYAHWFHRRVWRNGRWVPLSTRKRNRFGRVFAGEVVIEWIDDWQISTAYLVLGRYTPGYQKLEVRETASGEYVQIYLPDGRRVVRPSPRA